MPVKKLYRSQTNKMIAGVCGGLAEYFDLDPTLVRIFWLIFVFIGGTGFLAYLVAIFIIPKNPELPTAIKSSSSTNIGIFIGVFLIIFGFSIFMKKLGFFHFFSLWDIPWQSLWALILVFIGLVMIYPRLTARGTIDTSSGSNLPGSSSKRYLYRSVTDRKLAGVCGGLAEYFNIDSSLIRIVWILGTIASIGMGGILIYILLAIVIPESSQKDISSANPQS